MPLEGEKVEDGVPLGRMEKNTDETRDKTHRIQSIDKPKSDRVARMNF